MSWEPYRTECCFGMKEFGKSVKPIRNSHHRQQWRQWRSMGANEDGPNGANHAPHQTVGISIEPLALFTVIQNHQWEPLAPFALLALLPPFASSSVVIITSSTIVAIGIILAIGTICTISFHWVFWQTQQTKSYPLSHTYCLILIHRMSCLTWPGLLEPLLL